MRFTKKMIKNNKKRGRKKYAPYKGDYMLYAYHDKKIMVNGSVMLRKKYMTYLETVERGVKRAMENKNAKRIGVWGRSGSGKSTYVKSLIKTCNKLVVYDPMNEYQHEITGLVSFFSLQKMVNHMKKTYPNFKVAYVPPEGKEEEGLHELSKILQMWQKQYAEGTGGHKITLVVEEMNMCFRNGISKEQFYGFANLSSRGRHYGVEIIGVSQRLAEVDTRFRGNAEESVFFAQLDATDISTITRMLGNDYKDKILTLQNHEYYRRSNGVVEKGKNILSKR